MESNLEKSRLKGMTFDHNFGYSFLFPPKKRGKKNELGNIVIRSHTFQPGYYCNIKNEQIDDVQKTIFHFGSTQF